MALRQSSTNALAGRRVHIITGKPSEVTDAVDRYFRDYSPAGYGTQVTRRTFDEATNEVTVVIERSASCD